MNIEHLVTKKLRKGYRRIFFRATNSKDAGFSGEVVLQLRFLGLPASTWRLKVDVPGETSRNFYVDSPSRGARFGKFSWWWVSATEHFFGEGKNSGKKEDLTEVFGEITDL